MSNRVHISLCAGWRWTPLPIWTITLHFVINSNNYNLAVRLWLLSGCILDCSGNTKRKGKKEKKKNWYWSQQNFRLHTFTVTPSACVYVRVAFRLKCSFPLNYSAAIMKYYHAIPKQTSTEDQVQYVCSGHMRLKFKQAICTESVCMAKLFI